jgi:hypothetical protein
VSSSAVASARGKRAIAGKADGVAFGSVAIDGVGANGVESKELNLGQFECLKQWMALKQRERSRVLMFLELIRLALMPLSWTVIGRLRGVRLFLLGARLDVIGSLARMAQLLD